MKIGQTIKKYRKQKGLTLKELSELTGISISFLSDIERGRRNPSIENAVIIAKALSFDASIILPNDVKSILKESYSSSLHEEIKVSNIELNEKDKKEIDDYIAEIEKGIEGGLLFDGEPLSEESKQIILNSLRVGAELAKKQAKAKFTPKKYRQ